jgi:acyl-coenzyme A thioesterase PaaI-like protein
MTSPIDPAAEGWSIHDHNGFIGLVGPIWEKHDAGDLLFGFRAAEKHENLRGVVQGGMMMTFADRALGATGRLHNGNRAQATIQLDTHFIAPVRIGEFVFVRPKLVHQTRSMMFLEGTFTVDDHIVMTAKGVWKKLGS